MIATPLPQAFCQRLNTQFSTDEAQDLCEVLTSQPATISIRHNPLKPTEPTLSGQSIPWCKDGELLSTRPDFTGDPLFHAGCYYVQEAASMSIALAYEAMSDKPRLLLDLCAAPGGKTTLWRSLMEDGTLLVANEPIGTRAMILRENVQKWGHPDVVVTEDYPESFASLRGLFDCIAADVPCSGEGMFRKDEQARNEWSEHNAAMCAARQRQIIGEVWPALREGGYLVYSTCTFNPAENEDNVRWIREELGAEIIPIPTPTGSSIVSDNGMLHFYPHRTIGEGFFVALLRKTSSQSGMKLRKMATTTTLPKGWLDDRQKWVGLRLPDNHIYALQPQFLPIVTAICEHLHTLSVGVDTYSEKGKKRIPSHALALSTVIHRDAFAEVELTRSDAIRYLSREVLTLPPDAPRGYVLACYEHHPLGWLNNIGSRANNLYPAEWKIRRKTFY